MRKRIFTLACMFCAVALLPAQTKNDTHAAFRKANYNDAQRLDSLDAALQSEGYEWIEQEKYIEKEEKYPVDITYRAYASHPQYRIIDDCIYDTKGNLVRIIRLTRAMFTDDLMEHIRTAIYAQDYKLGKHDISQAAQSTHEALRSVLGLNRSVQKQSATDPKGSAIRTNSYGNENLNNEMAKRYIEQLTLDHEKDFAYIYEITRMNDTQFKLLFLDTKGKSSFTLKLSYGNMDKYKSGFFRPMLLETPPFSIDVATPTGIASTPSGVHTGQIYDIAEKNPNFPGGKEALNLWIAQNLKYPEAAVAQGVEGRVYVQFVVNADGSISDTRIIRSPDESLSMEVIRLIQSMPRWTPGEVRGKPVRTRFSMPILFKFK